MRTLLLVPRLLPGSPLAEGSRAQDAPKSADFQGSTVYGTWIINADFYGTPLNFSLGLNQEGDKLTGDFGGSKLEGNVCFGCSV
jgi:hypothetical protein